MSTFAIGDLQGCNDDFLELLSLIHFDETRDRLLLVGDLVNRGPASLDTLRTVRSLGTACISVLGNHDLHLLAAAQDRSRLKPGDTLDEILDAPDADALLDWLAERPLAWRDPDSGTLLLHAGVPPQWTAEQTLALAHEAAQVLRESRGKAFFEQMYGDRPDRWSEYLRGAERTRFVINCLTRLRYCTPHGQLRLRDKGPPGSQSAGALPWFEAPGRRTAGTPIVFGHWSALGRVEWPEHQVYGLDTGCVWGGQLTALNLNTGELTHLPCAGHRAPGGGD